MKNLVGRSSVDGRPQTLHILEEALRPLIPKDGDSMKYIGLTAGKLLENPDDYDLGDHEIGFVVLRLIFVTSNCKILCFRFPETFLPK